MGTQAFNTATKFATDSIDQQVEAAVQTQGFGAAVAGLTANMANSFSGADLGRDNTFTQTMG